MPHRNDRSDHPALQAAARLPAYFVLALMIVAVSAGGLLAARGDPAASETPPAVAGDVTESLLPTPVPPSETPLPTPVPLDQAAIVDTAVAFWVEFVPEELAIEYHDAIVAAGGVPWLASSPSARATAAPPAPSPDWTATPAPTGAADGATTDSADTGTSVPGVSEVQLTPPSDLTTPAPLPAEPLPSAELPLPTPTLPLPTPTLHTLLP